MLTTTGKKIFCNLRNKSLVGSTVFEMSIKVFEICLNVFGNYSEIICRILQIACYQYLTVVLSMLSTYEIEFEESTEILMYLLLSQPDSGVVLSMLSIFDCSS